MYLCNVLGRHPCLWCTINTEEMKVPREERAPVAPRTLDSLQADLLLFQTAGNGDLKKAKNYNNVIGPYFFHIPVINKNPSDARMCIKILHGLADLAIQIPDADSHPLVKKLKEEALLSAKKLDEVVRICIIKYKLTGFTAKDFNVHRRETSGRPRPTARKGSPCMMVPLFVPWKRN